MWEACNDSVHLSLLCLQSCAEGGNLKCCFLTMVVTECCHWTSCRGGAQLAWVSSLFLTFRVYAHQIPMVWGWARVLSVQVWVLHLPPLDFCIAGLNSVKRGREGDPKRCCSSLGCSVVITATRFFFFSCGRKGEFWFNLYVITWEGWVG